MDEDRTKTAGVDTSTMDTRRAHEKTESADMQLEGGLVSRLFTNVSDLTRSELALAKAEITQSVNDTRKGLLSLATGIAILIPGILLLLYAVALAIAQNTGMELWSATGLVGLIVAVVGIIMLMSARKKLSAENMTPARTQAMLAKDKEMIQGKLQ